jgi:hypothetical protein
MSNIKEEFVGSSQPSSQMDYNWFAKPEASAYQSICAVINKIDKNQSFRRVMNLRHARLYSNLEILGMAAYNTGTAANVPSIELDPNRITYNLVKSCIDTASNKIGKNRPKPQFLTSNGDYDQRDRASKLTTFIEGIFYQQKMYETAPKVFRDGCVFGTGALKIFMQDKKICLERALIDEIRVDDNDGLYGKPKSLYQVKQVTREALSSIYPDKAMLINQASSSTPSSSNVELIKVIEAWHLGKNGKHIICIENGTLFSEDYKKDYFPFVFYRWSERLIGFYGAGLAEELSGLQLEINRTLVNISEAQRLIAQPRVYLESTSNVSASQINNDIGSIVRYAAGSKPPVFHTPTAMNPEVYNHLKWLIQSGYEKTGISQMSATSKKPSGLDSGAALREYNDIETERFVLTGLQYEQFHLDAANIIVDMAKDAYKKGVDLTVNATDDNFLTTIKWSEVNLEEDSFVMKVFPTNLLPTSPSARIEKVQELIQAGWIDKTNALDLFDFPDVKAFESLETSNLKLIEKTINHMLKTGEYMPPEPQMQLDVAMQLAQKHYLLGRINEVEEDRLELILRFMDDCERLQKIGQANPTIVNPPAPAPVPMGVPEPLPQADLLPQVPV